MALHSQRADGWRLDRGVLAGSTTLSLHTGAGQRTHSPVRWPARWPWPMMMGPRSIHRPAAVRTSLRAPVGGRLHATWEGGESETELSRNRLETSIAPVCVRDPHL